MGLRVRATKSGTRILLWAGQGTSSPVWGARTGPARTSCSTGHNAKGGKQSVQLGAKREGDTVSGLSAMAERRGHRGQRGQREEGDTGQRWAERRVARLELERTVLAQHADGLGEIGQPRQY